MSPRPDRSSWRRKLGVPRRGDPEFLINACFAADRDPLTRADITAGRQRLRDTRRALLRLTEPGEARRDAHVQDILTHLARAETWYLDAMGMSIDEATLPSAPVARLGEIRDQVEAALFSWKASTAVVGTSGEDWTARKLLRRAIWHERDHSQQIATMLAPKRVV